MIESFVDDDIQIVRFNNPPSNSIGPDTLRQLEEILNCLNTGFSPKGLILTGQGRFFSSGFDLPYFLSFRDLDEAEAFFSYEHKVLLELFTCAKPVVCAVNGHAAAAGLIYSMAADYRIAKEHPKIKLGMSEIKIGLPLCVGHHEVMSFGLDGGLKFRDIVLSGRMLDVYEARSMGIVDELAAESDLLERAKQVVSGYIDTPNRPFMRMKELWKKDAADRFCRRLREEDWRAGLECFFSDEVRKALEFMQASMQ